MGITTTITTIISWELIHPATIALPKQTTNFGIYLGFVYFLNFPESNFKVGYVVFLLVLFVV